MTTKTKYFARYQGRIIGNRVSHRVYTHAVITQANEEAARKAAYEYQGDETDRQNFAYERSIVELGVNHPAVRGSWHTDLDRKQRIEAARQKTQYGFEGYVIKLREHRIEWFEKNRASGYFKPKVSCWCGRRDLAENEARKSGDTVLAIVPAETAGRG
jgi:hypothetical protein